VRYCSLCIYDRPPCTPLAKVAWFETAVEAAGSRLRTRRGVDGEGATTEAVSVGVVNISSTDGHADGAAGDVNSSADADISGGKSTAEVTVPTAAIPLLPSLLITPR
jgi:hypothetical protein